MTRSLAALVCFGAALCGAPTPSEAGVIPWMYDAIFGYGHHSPGWGYGAPYGGYMTGYAPFYNATYAQPAYGPSYGGGACCGNTVGYAPWTGYSYDAGCCSPCGQSCNPCCGSSCGTGCDPGCNNCPGGNCGTGSTNTVPSTPADSGTGANPTYAPPTSTNDRTLPADQFGPARNRDFGSGMSNPGSSVPTFGTPSGGSPVDPNNSAPMFGPGEPSAPRPSRGNEDSRRVPNTPFQPGEKVAFKTPARISRSELRPTFELPAVVSAPPRLAPETNAAPTAVASK